MIKLDKHTLLGRNAVSVLLGLLILTSCSDTISSIFGGGEIEQGDAVVFNTLVPDVKSATRSAMSEWKGRVEAYKAVNREYTFDVEMWKKGEGEATAASTYKPIWTDEDGEITYNADGTLQSAEGVTPLYWQDNVSEWGFKATTKSSDNIEPDQSDQTKWLRQDKLVGYSYLPIWNGDENDGHETDNVNKINYRTSKQWYADNKTAKELSGLMPESNDDYKKIPLYLQHQRSWVTIILKAGEGVAREALAYATSDANIKTTLYSYKDDDTTPTAITNAWSREELINYVSDKNGAAATGVSTTRYDAIVEPHNFIANADAQEKDIIARISVSNQNFTFAAANDSHYAAFIAQGDSPEKTAATAAMQAYNLEAGKHLTITATLSRASRMIMITAWIEDWTETVTQTICDDYGQNGDPILINNREQLEQFLSDQDKNKPGNVGLLVPNALSLTDDETWNSNYDLKATLNLAGATLSVNKRLVNNIERTGSIVNGEILVAEGFNEEAAVAHGNSGTIERVRVTTSSELTTARASKAGIVVDNHGTIYQCLSALPVYGNAAGYVGGIAATNLYSVDDGTIPTIDACTVTACVDGVDGVTAGGGIVGQAEGHVSNNTFEYGITLLQKSQFQNIIGAIGSHTGLTQHTNNSWPTTESYKVMNSTTEIVNAREGQHYNAVVDNQTELKTLLTSGYNNNTSIYRLAKSFTVNKDVIDSEGNSENWIWGNSTLDKDYFVTNATGTYASGNVKFKLDGNLKTITLTGDTHATMLFGNILGEVYDLNLTLDKPIVADRIMDKTNTDVDSNGDAIAAFAYAVTGTGSVTGKISNITLKASSDKYIQASTPAGIVVWASNGATITNCATNANVRMNLVFKTGVTGNDTRRYAGGIVAIAEQATITQCKYYGAKGSIGWVTDNTHCQGSNCRYGGIVGGTSEISGSNATPSLVLTDNSSWFELPTFGEDVLADSRPRMGSLIGSTVYHDPADATKLFHAMAEGNAGNWWTGTVGASYMKQGITEEQAIGKKNSVTPSIPKGW